MEIDKELLKGCIDTILICLLNTKDMYGYELVKAVKQVSEETFELKEGTLYLALKRLEKNNSIESYWGDGKSGGGRRKYYKITKIGKEYLHKKKEEWIFLNGIMNKFLGVI
ncbi:PadR family transcriptional regulator [Clostridium sporogenes]|uniref:PadR family transcriptional regulator n=1 Tax=unclassified Clostridium TaxID=2614128 RepID=UPI0006ABA4D0|nr:PadR family transcriptional regulator [Clostridium sp. L74]KOR26126.1 PadR family transcriptional regulator [Clostridium sp. L74]NFN86037.1 PadR family transcriptional regulator [Clostridium sporogenes]NFS26549.1 PadR family transcriptional regulator [Clostridium sporogenes]